MLRPPIINSIKEIGMWLSEFYKHFFQNIVNVFIGWDGAYTDISSNSARYGTIFYVPELDGKDTSSAIYTYVDPIEDGTPAFHIGMSIEISENQSGTGGTVGAGLGVYSKGHGDAIYVALFGDMGIGMEVASWADSTMTYGTMGFISTIQHATPHQNCTLFNGLWGVDTVVPAYGMVYLDGSPGGAITIHKTKACADNTEQIRIWNYAITETLFAVYSNGDINTKGVLKVEGVKVVGDRVIDSRIDDTINSGDATTDGVIDAIRDALITHGLIAAS